MNGRPPIQTADEERVAAEMSRELDSLAAQSGIRAPDGFADRVMAAVAGEPLPQPVRAFRVAVVRRRLGAALASLGDAWRVGFGGSWPIAIRAQALALVLVVAVASVALAGGVAVGTMGLLTAHPSSAPSPTTLLPSVTQPSPVPTPSPSPRLGPVPPPEPAVTPKATKMPESTGTPDATRRPETPRLTTPRPTGTDDHGGGSGGGDRGSGGVGGSGGGDPTPSPTETSSNDPGDSG